MHLNSTVRKLSSQSSTQPTRPASAGPSPHRSSSSSSPCRHFCHLFRLLLAEGLTTSLPVHQRLTLAHLLAQRLDLLVKPTSSTGSTAVTCCLLLRRRCCCHCCWWLLPGWCCCGCWTGRAAGSGLGEKETERWHVLAVSISPSQQASMATGKDCPFVVHPAGCQP